MEEENIEKMEEENKEEKQEDNEVKIESKPEKKKEEKMEKFQLDKLHGRVIIFNPQESEFAKNLGLTKKGDYVQKKQ